ncbi:MAG TPA: class IV adenylate cyclase [Bacteroidales bacterium]|nr:class IV adenylate cyclase [Bacteroidales bacterium]HPT01114.1 class IV adenylate cyclase [Bacteroidales bacterium]
MNIKNFEFKASVDNIEKYENLLLKLNPRFQGTDHQTDTYFNTGKGRLKLREGNIENSLVDYNRENLQDSKKSEVILYRHAPSDSLKSILVHQFGILVVVKKIRKIYFIGNVKFHFDEVENLGSFIEVEAIDDQNKFSDEDLKEQCDYYYRYFGIQKEQLQKLSYSDMLLNFENKE